MTHFVVTVISDSLEEESLYKYIGKFNEENNHEFIDIHEHVIEMYQKYGSDYTSLDEYAKDNYYIKGASGKYGVCDNPIGKYDYWVTGGRWSKTLRYKDTTDEVNIGGCLYETSNLDDNKCDACKIRDIDFEAMKEDGEEFWAAAIVINGIWYDYYESEHKEEWTNEFNRLLSGIDKGMYLHIIDCHV